MKKRVVCFVREGMNIMKEVRGVIGMKTDKPEIVREDLRTEQKGTRFLRLNRGLRLWLVGRCGWCPGEF